MNTSLLDILCYLVANYPHKKELSKARVTKMIFLADWYHAKKFGRQMTDLKWVFNHYGPYVEDVYVAAKGDNRFSIEQTNNMFGFNKELISLSENAACSEIDSEIREILDRVIADTAPLHWREFISLIYSTDPVKKSERYGIIDIAGAADTNS